MPLRSFTQAEMVVTERRRFERPLLVTVWLGVAALGLVEARWFYVFAATLVVGVNLLSLRQDREVYLRRGFINMAVLASIAILVIELVMSPISVLQSVGHYVVLIQLCKLFERKGNRDYVQILALSGLVMTSACLQSSDAWFAGVLVTYLSLACYTAMAFTLKRGLDAAAAARLSTEAAPLAPSQVVWNVRGTAARMRDGATGWPTRVLRGYVARILAVALTLGVAMFLVAPRRASGPGGGSQDHVSGAGVDSVVLGLGGKIHLSDRVVMKVRADSPPRGGYLRGRVFSRYRASRWTATPVFRYLIAGGEAVPEKRVLDEVSVHEILMVPELLPTLYVPASTVRVTAPRGRVITAGGLYEMSDRNWRTPTVRYRAMVALTGRADRYEPIEIGTVQVTPRVGQLAELWCGELVTMRDIATGKRRDELDLEIAAVIAQRLGRRCTYTLDLADANPERDGVEDFLFYMKSGHCEYFASAMTVMCHSLGVRARLVGGFRIDGLPAGAGSFVVRQRDAHAWTEVFTPSEGWVTFDPSGPAARPENSGVLTQLTDEWESARFFWHEHVVGYDSLARQRLGDWLGRGGRAIWLGMMKTGQALKESSINLLVEGYVDRALARLAVVAAAAGLLVAGVLTLRIRRRRAALRAIMPVAMTRRQLAFARKFFKLLERHGHPQSPQQTVRQWVYETAGQLGLAEAAVGELVDMYYALRWGLRAMDEQQLRLAEQKVAALTADMSA